MIIETRCIRCGECVRVCPHGDEVSAERLPAKVEHCELCEACVEACPTGARQIVGRKMSVDDIIKAVLQDRVFFEDSGGGVTFSGGEPLAQPEFLRDALTACRRHGVHTAVDTCGFAPLGDLMRVAKATDLFLYDLKFMDEGAHLRYTGKPNRLILDNLRALARLRKPIWVRIPVIPGINDCLEELRALATFASSLESVQQVNLLPFHANGLRKGERLGKPVRLGGTEPPTATAMAAALEVFKRAGVPARAGG